MKKYIVYKHTNKTNGKVYIGITCQKSEKRWMNGYGYRRNDHFFKSILKYGWDNFEHEILYENLEKMQAELLEISLIRFYDSTNPDKGYNIRVGGSASDCSDETRKKISESNKGRKFSDEHKRKLSESHKGYTVLPETRKKISESFKGHPYWGGGGHKQPVVCVETGVEYESYGEASDHLDASISCVYNAVKRGHACKGYHFKKI